MSVFNYHLRGMISLEVFLQVELDHVLLAAKVAVVDRARFPRDVHLDLLAGAEGGRGVDEGGDPLVRGSDVILDGLDVVELSGAVLALVDLVGPPVVLMVCLDVVTLANFQWILFTTEATIIFDIAVWMLPELVLDCNCHSLKCFLADIT